MSRLLIVNADDYGLTHGTSRAIVDAHLRGIVTATSVLANAPAARATLPWLADVPDLEVGVHLAIVGEDPPVLTGAEVPTLVDRRGRFPSSWRAAVPRLVAGRVDPEDLRRELATQVELVRAGGARIDHLDTHQHLHLVPSVGAVVLEMAAELGAATRLPTSFGTGLTDRTVNRLAARLRTQARAAGVPHADRFVGFPERGRLTAERLVRALDVAVASGATTLELGAHPGAWEDDERSRYRWRYEWGSELGALTDARAHRWLAERSLHLGDHTDLPA